MKKLILITLIISLLQIVKAQTSIEQIKIPKLKGNLSCFYKPVYAEAERNRFYPFNISATIKICSFRHHRLNYPIKGDSLLVDSLLEIKTLTKADKSKLTDIIYNNFYKQKPNYGSITQCFVPRNAILFFDETGRLVESILLCFHCGNFKLSSDKVAFGDKCTQKVEKLRKLFVELGLKFGTDSAIVDYLGEESDEGIYSR
jgi:hypothetical protein